MGSAVRILNKIGFIIIIFYSAIGCGNDCEIISPTSNSDLKNFSHCTSAGQIDLYIEGNSTREGDYSQITDLSPLKNIKSVERKIQLGDMRGLVNLKGLHNIKTAGSFHIYNLPDFDGTKTEHLKLESVGDIFIEDSLEYNDSPIIKDLTFLKDLKYITKSAYFRVSDELGGLSDMESLISVNDLRLAFDVRDFLVIKNLKLTGYLRIGSAYIDVCNGNTSSYDTTICTDKCNNLWIPFFEEANLNIVLDNDFSNLKYFMDGCGYTP